MALRVDVDQQLGAGEARAQVVFHPIDDLMRAGDRHGAGQIDMELDEIVRAAGAGAQVVQV